MKPKDRIEGLEEIYFKHLRHVKEDVRISFQRSDIKWLIKRAKHLAEALEYTKNTLEAIKGYDLEIDAGLFKACAALNDEDL
jgi:hypothetical protein